MLCEKTICLQKCISQRIEVSDIQNPVKFPFIHFCHSYGLKLHEKKVLLFLLKYEHERRLNPCNGFQPNGDFILRGISVKLSDIWNLRKILFPESTLLKSGVIRRLPVSGDFGYPDWFFSGEFIIVENARRLMFGEPPYLKNKRNPLPDVEYIHLINPTAEQDKMKIFQEEPEPNVKLEEGVKPVSFQNTDKKEEENKKLLEISTPQISWESVILPENLKNKINSLIHPAMMIKGKEWGMEEIFGYSNKILFYGNPGTGKTLAASAIASKCKSKLGVVKFPQVVSKWVGDTEKAVAKIFQDAKESNCVLLIDEADALLHSRISNPDSSAANSENRSINILLQEVENFKGILILTTNFEMNLDPALERRIQVKLFFPDPTPELSVQIYKSIIPTKCPYDQNIDFHEFAKTYPMSGGYIKNVVSNAARLAILRNATCIERIDFENAANQELRIKEKAKMRPIGFGMMD